jgi:ADP-ribosylglycohydrolase
VILEFPIDVATPLGRARLSLEGLSVGDAFGERLPFAFWCAARHLDDFQQVMWTRVSGLGDRDTTCAIVGGIVALAVGPRRIPSEWIAARERLDSTLTQLDRHEQVAARGRHG